MAAMFFIYQYRVSDGRYREDMIEAANRDEAFSLLRKNGIRPSKLWAKDIGYGMVQNDKGVMGFGKRWLFAVAFAASSLSLAVALLLMNSRDRPSEQKSRHRIESNIVEIGESFRIAKPRQRRQLGRLPSKEMMAHAFRHPSEVYLASFAEPGKPVRAADAKEIVALAEDLYDAIEDVIQINAGDPRELIDLKRIVAGIKDDAAMLIASGKTAEDVFDWLAARQQMEVEHRASIVKAASFDPEERTKANKKLEAMGFAPIAR